MNEFKKGNAEIQVNRDGCHPFNILNNHQFCPGTVKFSKEDLLDLRSLIDEALGEKKCCTNCRGYGLNVNGYSCLFSLDCPCHQTEQKKEQKIRHANPNCLDATKCKPHGETGPVKYYGEQDIE